MRLRHILVCLLFIGSIRADVRLGPEQVISPPQFPAPTIDPELNPRIASNGRDFLAVWYRAGSGLHSLRLDEHGVPAETYAHRFFDLSEDFREIAIASNGTDYLVAWTTSRTAHWIRLDENGRAVAPPHTIPSPRLGAVALASNGTTYALAWAGEVIILNDEGGFVTTLQWLFGRPLWLGVRDGRYQLLDGSVAGIRLYTLDEEQAFISRVDVDTRTDRPVAAAASDTHLVIAIGQYDLNRPGVLRLLVADRDGDVLKTENLPNIDARHVVAGWDGSSFLVTWTTNTGALSAYRVRPDGTRDGGVPLSRSARGAPSIASNEQRHLMVWAAEGSRARPNSDVAVRVVSSFNELALDPAPDVISLAPNANVAPRIARSGEHELIAWVSDADQKIAGTLDGRPVVIASFGAMHGVPAIAGGTKGFAVAWYERLSDTEVNVVATRVAFDGTVAPLTRFPLRWLPNDHEDTTIRPGLAFGNSIYLIAARHWANLFLIRMDEDRPLGSEERQPISGEGAPLFSPQVVWTGVDFAIASFTGSVSHWNGSQFVYDVRLKLYRFGLRNGSFTLLHEVGSPELSLGLAVGPNRLTVLTGWPNRLSLYQREPTLLEPRFWRAPSVPQYPDADDIELVWNGSEYVAVWDNDAQPNPLLALRFDEGGEAIDRDAFRIAEDAFDPSVIATPQGVRIVYTRSDNRVYARTLEPISRGPRLRTVRR